MSFEVRLNVNSGGKLKVKGREKQPQLKLFLRWRKVDSSSELMCLSKLKPHCESLQGFWHRLITDRGFYGDNYFRLSEMTNSSPKPLRSCLHLTVSDDPMWSIKRTAGNTGVNAPKTHSGCAEIQSQSQSQWKHSFSCVYQCVKYCLYNWSSGST